MKQLMEHMVIAPNAEWKLATTHMSWAMRRSTTELPNTLTRYLTAMPTEDQWKRLVKLVNMERRRRRGTRYVEKTEAQRAARRAYMREYMAAYRTKARD